MTETTVVSEKFTVTYKCKSIGFGDGDDGFLGHDETSGGYPYFTSAPEDHYLRDSLVDAIKDATMMKTNMKMYNGHEKVLFDTIRVVRYKIIIETIDDLAAAHHDALVISAREKLDDEEFGALAAELRKDCD